MIDTIKNKRYTIHEMNDIAIDKNHDTGLVISIKITKLSMFNTTAPIISIPALHETEQTHHPFLS